MTAPTTAPTQSDKDRVVIFDTTLPYAEGGHEQRVRFQDVDVARYSARQAPDEALTRRFGSV